MIFFFPPNEYQTPSAFYTTNSSGSKSIIFYQHLHNTNSHTKNILIPIMDTIFDDLLSPRTKFDFVTILVLYVRLQIRVVDIELYDVLYCVRLI